MRLLLAPIASLTPSINNHADCIVSAFCLRLSLHQVSVRTLTQTYLILLLSLNLSELERQANIAKNKALLDELELTDAVDNIGFSKKPPPPPPKAKAKAKPVQPSKRTKREVVEDTGPRRQSARLKRSADDPNESPEKKRARLVRTLPNPVTFIPCLVSGTTFVASRGAAATRGRGRTSPSRGA